MTLSVVLTGQDPSKDSQKSEKRVSAFLSLKNFEWEIHLCKNSDVCSSVLSSKGRYVLVADMALSTPIKEVDKLLRALEGGLDMAAGSRVGGPTDCDVRQSVAGCIRETLLNAFSGTGLRDARCAFKAYNREAAQKIFSHPGTDDALGVQAARVAKRLRLRIAEVPVMWGAG